MLPLRPRGRGRTTWSLLGSIISLYCSRTYAQSNPTVAGSFPDCVSPWFLVDSEGRTPCQMLSEQMSDCTGEAAFTIPLLSSQSLGLYPAPDASVPINLVCECTEAIYNLFQACAACQNATDLSSRVTWFKMCPMSLSDIPIKTENMTDQTFWVDQTYNPGFTLDVALEVARTNQPPPNNGSSSGQDSNSPNVPSSLNSSGSRKKSNTGMIVGIVVGVIGFIVILALLFFLFVVKRKRSRTAPSAEFMKYAQPNAATIPLTQTTMDEESTHSPQVLHLRDSVHRGDSGGGLTDESEAPPSFTPGLFKDPIFEKGAALNIANNAGYTASTGSPLTYSPATPSGVNPNPENQQLIGSSSSAPGQMKRGSL